MLIAKNLFLGIPDGAAERTALLGPPSRTGAVEGQTDPAVIVEGLVALGAPEEGEQGLPRCVGIEPLGEIAQGIVTERSCDGESASCGRSYQCLDGMKTRLAEDLADQQGPQQSLRRNLRLLPTVSRILEIPSEAKTPGHIVEQTTWRRTVHFFFFLGFLRSSTSSCALAANTSRTAS